MKYYGGYCMALLVIAACNNPEKKFESLSTTNNVSVVASGVTPGYTPDGKPVEHIITGKTTPAELVTYATSLTGIPYKYGSIDPKEGFDCSGFITYVFHHFGIIVPRRSVDFTNVDHEISLQDAKTGDLILFTGTDSTDRTVGHMGIIITQPTGPPKFIHSTSGKAYGVTTTPLNTYYMGRYMKTIRIFPQNELTR
jgi:murein DD-endopeptidase / murein LD-carboxypeptidase